MFEHKSMPPLEPPAFRQRLARHFLWALLVVAGALGIGMAGYHFLAGQAWIDALVNASMILGGMGPVDPVKSDAGKIFASLYALFSGLAFLSVTAILFAPLFHRLIHRFHWEQESDDTP